METTFWLRGLSIRDIPVTCSLVSITLSLFAFLRWKNASVSAFSSSYDLVVKKHEFWRLLLSPFSHVDFLHLAFNLLCIWSHKELELYLSSIVYLQTVALLLLLSSMFHLLYIHQLVSNNRQQPLQSSFLIDRFQHSQWFGFSSLSLGCFTIYTNLAFWDVDNSIALLGFIPVPFESPLFVLFVLETIEVCLTGKLFYLNNMCGVVAGLALSVGLFDWLTPYFMLCLMQWCLIALLYSKGFPPALETEQVVQQRRVEQGFAARVRRTNQEQGRQESGRGIRDIEILIPERLAREWRGDRLEGTAEMV